MVVVTKIISIAFVEKDNDENYEWSGRKFPILFHE